MIPTETLASLKQRLADLSRPVTLEYFQSGGSKLVVPGREAAPCRDCKPTLEMLQEVSGLSELLHLEVREITHHARHAAELEIDRVPALVFRSEGDRRLSLYGLPAGNFLSVLLGGVLLLGRSVKSDPAIADVLAQLEKRLLLRVLGTVTHDTSTSAVLAAYTLAANYEGVQAEAYVMETFPDLVRQLEMTHAPLTVINEDTGFPGVTTPAELAGYALQLQDNPEAANPPQVLPGSIGEVHRRARSTSQSAGASAPGPAVAPARAPRGARANPVSAPRTEVAPPDGPTPLAPRPDPVGDVSPDMSQADVAIIGGGPAGLQAALVLARALKSVVIFDEPSPPRNAASHGLHGFLGMEGMSADEFRRAGWEQINQYSGASLREDRVVDVQPSRDGDFLLTTEEGQPLRAREVVVASGYRDVFPDIAGFAECWGETIVPCVLCDGYEHRNRAWGIADSGSRTTDPIMALNWTKNVQFIQGSETQLDADYVRRLEELDIRVHKGRIVGITHNVGTISAVSLDNGTELEIETLLWMPPTEPVPLVGRLVDNLGLTINAAGNIAVDPRQRTNIEHLWAAGDVGGLTGAIAAARQGQTVAERIIHGWYQ